MALALHPAHDPRSSIAFVSFDALAAHLIRQKPDRAIELCRTQASIDGGPLTDGVSAWAIRPRDRRAFMDDPAAFEADWLGLAFAGERPFADLTAALDRVVKAGGAAA